MMSALAWFMAQPCPVNEASSITSFSTRSCKGKLVSAAGVDTVNARAWEHPSRTYSRGASCAP